MMRRAAGCFCFGRLLHAITNSSVQALPIVPLAALLGILAVLNQDVARAAAADAKKAEPTLTELIEKDWVRQARWMADPSSSDSPKMTPALDAAGAVDGLKNGKWAFHTDLEEKPWWQVDLGEPVDLGHVLVYNRCDCGPGSASRILVLLSDDGESWRQAYQHDGTVFLGFPDKKPLRVDLSGQKARFVRLQLPHKAYFYLDEVEVYPKGSEENIALRKPALQSSISRWSQPPAPPEDLAESHIYPVAAERALELARRTLAFVERTASRPEMAAQLGQLQKRLAAAQHDPEADLKALYFDIRRFRRELLFSHPRLDFQRLLINKRPPPGFSHQSDQYLGRHSGPGPGLVILDSWKENPRQTELLEGRLPQGSMLHPDLSPDGSRVLFSYCDHTIEDKRYRRFFIYEASIDGHMLRQVTGTATDPLEGDDGRQTVLIEDWDPCYLPDGGIAFVSTRNQGGVRCHHGGRYCPTYHLYRCEADGSAIRHLSFGEANEWEPSVMHDGRIIWTRWDYINRHDTVYQGLWTIRPDGTGTAHFYGSYTRNPCAIGEAKAIPGSHKILATAFAHHSYTAGSLIVIDPHKGQDGEEPITRLTPEAAFPETEGWPSCAYATPHPLSEDLALASFSPAPLRRQGQVQESDTYAIYLVDSFGGRELIYRDPTIACFSPIPIEPRPEPPAMHSALTDLDAKTGTFYVRNVYASTEDIPSGSIKKLRVVRVDSQTTQCVPGRSVVLFETPKRILGTAPVADDGSVAFRVPAGEPLLFQLLDENDMAVMSMRSFVLSHPSENQSCVGCHEPRHSTPQRLPLPDGVKFHELDPPVGPDYPGGLGFVKTVQPVLDRHCIGCHGLDKTEGGLDLLGTMKLREPCPDPLISNVAYDSLIGRKGLVSTALRNKETPRSKVKDYFSHAGRLAPMLLTGDEHHEKLDRESFLRIVYWLDLNAQFYGDYSWNKPEWRKPSPEGEKALREHIGRTFGPELAEQPFAALVNVGLPEESRILKAPLAQAAGGWGQIEPGWKSTDESGYRQMRKLVEAAITPLEFHDVAGTCNQPNCKCRSCWIREARQQYKSHLMVGAEDGEEPRER